MTLEIFNGAYCGSPIHTCSHLSIERMPIYAKACTEQVKKMVIDPSQIRIRFITACKWLDVSREGLRYIMKTDESFPRPIKTGSSKQSPVYFDYNELLEWHKTKLEGRSASVMEA